MYSNKRTTTNTKIIKITCVNSGRLVQSAKNSIDIIFHKTNAMCKTWIEFGQENSCKKNNPCKFKPADWKPILQLWISWKLPIWLMQLISLGWGCFRKKNQYTEIVIARSICPSPFSPVYWSLRVEHFRQQPHWLQCMMVVKMHLRNERNV